MIKPPALRSGDRIAVVSPASPFSRDEFDKGVEELRRLGYEPTWDDSVFERSLYTSGSAEHRAAAFLRAWSDPAVAAVMAVRGGYGSVQILPELDGWDPTQAPKVFIGYSDHTSMLSWLTCQCGIAAVHGPMLADTLAKGRDRYDERSFLTLLQGDGAGLVLQPDGVSVIREGEATGCLYGGTLTQLCASLGTPYAFGPPDRSILFIEDVNERPYRIDRMLTQLRLGGFLWRAQALVFGEMRGCDEPGGEPSVRGVIERLTADFDGPVLFGFPSGHTAGPSWSLPLGVRVRVQTRPRASIVIEESPVG